MCFKPYAINPKNGAVSSRSIFVSYILRIYESQCVNITAVKYHGGRNYKIGSIHTPTTTATPTQITTQRPAHNQPRQSPPRIYLPFPRNSQRFPSRCGGGGGLGAGIPSGNPIAGIHPSLGGGSSLPKINALAPSGACAPFAFVPSQCPLRVFPPRALFPPPPV